MSSGLQIQENFDEKDLFFPSVYGYEKRAQTRMVGTWNIVVSTKTTNTIFFY